VFNTPHPNSLLFSALPFKSQTAELVFRFVGISDAGHYSGPILPRIDMRPHLSEPPSISPFPIPVSSSLCASELFGIFYFIAIIGAQWIDGVDVDGMGLCRVSSGIALIWLGTSPAHLPSPSPQRPPPTEACVVVVAPILWWWVQSSGMFCINRITLCGARALRALGNLISSWASNSFDLRRIPRDFIMSSHNSDRP